MRMTETEGGGPRTPPPAPLPGRRPQASGPSLGLPVTSCLCGSQSSRLGSRDHVESGQRGGEATQLCSAPTALASHGLFPRGGRRLVLEPTACPAWPRGGCGSPLSASGRGSRAAAAEMAQPAGPRPREETGESPRPPGPEGLPSSHRQALRQAARAEPVTPFLSSTAQSPVLWALCHRRPGDPNLPAEVRAGGGGFPGTSWRTHCRSSLLQSFGPSCLVPTSPSPDPGPVQRNRTEPQDRHCSEPTENEDETLT